MAQARRKKEEKGRLAQHVTRGLREAALLILGTLGIYLLVSLASYHSLDPGWSHSGTSHGIRNSGGVVGAWLADILLYLLGYLAYLLPVMLAYSGWLVFKGRSPGGGIDLHILAIRWSGFLLTVGAGCGLATLEFGLPSGVMPAGAGGVLGSVVGSGLAGLFSPVGANLFLLALFLTGVTLFTGLSWLSVMDFTGKYFLLAADNVYAMAGRLPEYIAGWRAQRQRQEHVRTIQEKSANRKPPRIEPVIKPVQKSERQERERQVPLFDPPPNTELPPLSLLDPPRPSGEGYSPSALEAMSRLVEMKLLDFNIEVQVVEVHPGPVITRFELDLGAGVKVSQPLGATLGAPENSAALSLAVTA